MLIKLHSQATTTPKVRAAIRASSPKGMGALGTSEWACDQCGFVHHRDVNTARNILALGHERLAGGMPVL